MADDQPPLPTGPTRYAVYARVSSAGQADRQISIPQQHRECRSHVLARGGLLVREFQDEAISGETLDRPGLQALLAHARAGADPAARASPNSSKKAVTRNAHFDAVIVWKLDRLSRPNDDEDLDFLLIRRELRRCGVRLESVTEPWVAGATEMDQFMGYLGRGQTSMEAAIRERRFRLGRQGIAEMGRQVGPPPYGYDYKDPDPGADQGRRRGRPWVPVEPQASWVAWVYGRLLAGETASGIARALNARAVPPPGRTGQGARRGGALRMAAHGWTPAQVGEILRNRRYAGYVHFEGRWYRADDKPQGHPALVPPAEWEAAQGVLAGRGRRRAAASGALFAGGLLRCPLCAARGVDTPMVVWGQQRVFAGAGGAEVTRRYVSYRCSLRVTAEKRAGVGAGGPPSPCPPLIIGEAVALRALRAALARLSRGALTPGDRAAADGPLRPRLPDRREGADAMRREMARELSEVPLMAANYREQQARGLTSMDALAQTLAALAAREAGLRAALAGLADEKPPDTATPAEAAQLLRLLDDGAATPMQRRDGLRSVLRSVTVGADRRTVTLVMK